MRMAHSATARLITQPAPVRTALLNSLGGPRINSAAVAARIGADGLKPLMVIQRPSEPELPTVSRLDLAPLTPQATEQLIHHALGGRVEPRLLAQLVAQSGGNRLQT